MSEKSNESKKLTKSEREILKVRESHEKSTKTNLLRDFLDKHKIMHSLFYVPMKINAGVFMYKISALYSGKFKEEEYTLIKNQLIEIKKDLDVLIEEFN